MPWDLSFVWNYVRHVEQTHTRTRHEARFQRCCHKLLPYIVCTQYCVTQSGKYCVNHFLWLPLITGRRGGAAALSTTTAVSPSPRRHPHRCFFASLLWFAAAPADSGAVRRRTSVQLWRLVWQLIALLPWPVSGDGEKKRARRRKSDNGDHLPIERAAEEEEIGGQWNSKATGLCACVCVSTNQHNSWNYLVFFFCLFITQEVNPSECFVAVFALPH